MKRRNKYYPQTFKGKIETAKLKKKRSALTIIKNIFVIVLMLLIMLGVAIKMYNYKKQLQKLDHGKKEDFRSAP